MMKRSLVAALTGWCVLGTMVVAPPARPVDALNLQTVVAESANNSLRIKTVDARCPPGTRVYGGGAWILDGDQAVTFAGMEPYMNATVSGYYVVAGESPLGGGQGNFTGSWRVKAFARCGSGLSGVEVVSAVSTTSDRSPTQYQATAFCPADKVVIATGFRSSYLSVPAHWIRPIRNGTAVQAVVQEDLWNSEFASDPLTVLAVALCAPRPPGWRIDAVGTQPLAADPQVLYSFCTGGEVLGGGLTKFDGDRPGAYRITGFFPDVSGGLFAIEGGSLLPVQNPTGWALGSWAICADK